MGTSNPRILVTHPGRQHSHQAARGLHGAGMLASYWSGVPASAGSAGWVPRRAWRGYEEVPLPKELTRTFASVPALRRLSEKMLPASLARLVDYFACRHFDRLVASALPRVRPDGVIACEISALETFRTARRLGVRTFLDAPSLHHAAQDRLHGTDDSAALHSEILAVKDGEIDLADHVFTVSDLARSTYLAAEVEPQKVHAIPLGADLDLFSPRTVEARPDDGVFTFVFVGATIRRKGFDLLLEAFRRVSAAAPRARLRLVGPLVEQIRLLHESPNARVAAVGPLPQHDLARELRAADCLVLPSRNDSYAMVVAESLACGTPAIVSEMVGAKQLLAEGHTGWVVANESAEALAGRMAWCVQNSEAVQAMRPACREAALQATWPAYHSRLSALVASLMASSPSSARLS